MSSFSTMMLLHAALLVTGVLDICHGLAASSAEQRLPPLSLSRSSMIQKYIPLAQKAMEYIDASSDPFHAVQTSVDLLTAAGFELWNSNDDSASSASPPALQAGGKYYFTKNKSTLVAFAVGKHYKPGNGLKIIAGHTDSPNLRVKTRSQRGSPSSAVGGCLQIGVECYGGGLWHTWFDRDLGLSGRVFVRSSSSSSPSSDSGGGSGGGKIEQRLVKIDRALLRISNLAIHLQTTKEREAFAYNKEDHLSPILSMEVKKALTGTTATNDDTSKKDDSTSSATSTKEDSSSTATASKKDGWTEHQEPALLEILAHELGLENANDIVDFELNLFDIQKAVIGGAFGEFVHSARLDNLASCFMAVQALVEYVSCSSTDDGGNGSLLDEDEGISMICLYDHEEVGSSSAVGAASPILTESIRRICSASIQQASESSALSFEEVHRSCIAKSFALSSDQAHAVHPNYASKHEKAHQPKMNDGMVIKRNSNQRYATTPVTGLLMREIAKRAGLPPLQEFLVRQDCGCGSTIGPIMSTLTGIRTIDMGCPQLSMHSIRETMGTCDLTFGLDLFKAYFRYFNEVDKSVESS